ncbi:MAG: DUF4760 domain-containing protein [Candidatus Eremiobacteraeota bacterium]|nr:DUF4760 domain-containing protein [Candidatus Eremiobacteraeota bacterium]
MSLEVLNTTGTLLTVIIVAATAVAALVQMRHLRTGNQINALLTIGEKFQDRHFLDASSLVNHSITKGLDDPSFRAYVVARARNAEPPVVTTEYSALQQAARLVGNFYEQLGNLVKNRVVDEDLFMDQYCQTVAGTWKRMEGYTALLRAATDDIGLWDNFEYLTVRARQYLVKYPTTYPKHVPRIQVTNPWPLQ